MHTEELLCLECGSKYGRQGSYELLPTNPNTGEPAEWVRIIRGSALAPTTDQRTIWVGDMPQVLEQGFYNCDLCNGKIKPSDDAVCRTIWMPIHGPEPEEWEHQFVFI